MRPTPDTRAQERSSPRSGSRSAVPPLGDLWKYSIGEAPELLELIADQPDEHLLSNGSFHSPPLTSIHSKEVGPMEVRMIKDKRSHTTLPAADLARAKKFYAEKLGLTPSSESPNGVFYVTGGGTRFILYPTPNSTRAGHTQIGFSVDDIDKEVAGLRAAGVRFEEYDFPGFKTEHAIAQTGETRAAWFKDSEGNLIGLVQLAPGAEPA